MFIFSKKQLFMLILTSCINLCCSDQIRSLDMSGILASLPEADFIMPPSSANTPDSTPERPSCLPSCLKLSPDKHKGSPLSNTTKRVRLNDSDVKNNIQGIYLPPNLTSTNDDSQVTLSRANRFLTKIQQQQPPVLQSSFSQALTADTARQKRKQEECFSDEEQ